MLNRPEPINMDFVRKIDRATGNNETMINPDPPRSAERLTVSLIQPAVDALNEILARTFATKADAFNRAIQLYNRLDALQARGGSIYIQEPGESELSRVEFF
jgi:hypothetical protein